MISTPEARNTVFDHLIVAAPSLSEGIAFIQNQIGVTAVVGGSHPGVGTCNALIALGPDCYLEVMAPDPSQAAFVGERPFGIDGLTQTRLVAWVARRKGLAQLVNEVRAKGFEISDAMPVSRTMPSGEVLAWEMSMVANRAPANLGALPLLIDWLDSPHPASQLGQGAVLESLELTHPKPDEFQPIIDALELDLTVKQRDNEGLRAVINCVLGKVELCSFP